MEKEGLSLMDLEDEEYLEVENSKTKVWLVKVPKFVSERWKEIESSGQELGTLRIHKSRLKNSTAPKVTMILNDESIPKNYNVTMTNIQSRNQYIFTENSAGQAVEVMGRVEHEASAGPVIDEDYRKIMQMRTKNAMDQSNQRQAQIIQGKDRNLIATAGNQWDEGAKFSLRGRAKKSLAEKKERLPREDLLDMIFRLYEIKNIYTFKQLIDKTQQPVGWLKEVLTDICVLIRRGPNSGNYELKDEYKQAPVENANASEPSKS